jgi:hypothetical protein
MQQSTLAITYAQPLPDQGDLLMIEQEEWGKNTGVVTTAEMMRYVSAWVYNQLYRASTDCGVVDGQLTCTINIYPRMPQLVYQLHTSWGNLSGPRGGMTTVEEILNFTLTTEERPRYPVHSISAAHWLAECYDVSGAVVTPPALTIDGDAIVITEPVYGSVQVRYRTERYSHTLSIPRREDALEEFFSAAVYALYSGGLTWIEIDLPNSFDEANATERCGLSGSGSVTWPEDDPRPIADNPYRRKTVVDYCSQTIISDEIS